MSKNFRCDKCRKRYRIGFEINTSPEGRSWLSRNYYDISGEKWCEECFNKLQKVEIKRR